MRDRNNLRKRLRPFYERAKKVPAGLRSLGGILLVASGLLGFLPVLGFWMAPLGMMFIALDIAPLRDRVEEWFG